VPKTIEIRHFPNLFTGREAHDLYRYLQKTIQWDKCLNSERAKKEIHLVKLLSLDEDERVEWAVREALKRMNLSDYIIYGVSVNYYRDGADYTPSHKHDDLTQLIISLNEIDGDRSLKIGKKDYRLNNGDVIIFGCSMHGIPKEENRCGRISISTFMRREELGGYIVNF
jgi:hypothetical protein